MERELTKREPVTLSGMDENGRHKYGDITLVEGCPVNAKTSHKTERVDTAYEMAQGVRDIDACLEVI